MLVHHEGQARDVPAKRERGRELLRLEGVHAPGVGPLDLSLHAHEVVGLTGLPGSGLHDVAYLLSGATRLTSGAIAADRQLEVGLVPPHRETQGGFDQLSVTTNLTISALPAWRSRSRLLRRGRERQQAHEMSRSLSVRPDDPDAEFGTLSGGNKQKVIFGRVLLRHPDLYVLCEPTRGVDVATRTEIYNVIGQLRSQDAAVLVVSSDAEDLFAVCDRIGVVHEGRIKKMHQVEAFRDEEMEMFV
jgi:ribose transport system ATP-binding protein